MQAHQTFDLFYLADGMSIDFVPAVLIIGEVKILISVGTCLAFIGEFSLSGRRSVRHRDRRFRRGLSLTRV